MSADAKSPKRLVVQLHGDSRAPAELPRKGRMTVGSDPERVDYVVNGQGVDAVHCAIGRLKGGGWALQDLGSKFGTLLNGKPVQAKRLKAGDEILIGAVRLLVSDPEAAGAGPAPSRPAAPAEPAKAQAAAPRPQAAAKPKRQAKTGAPPSIPGFRLSRPLGQGATGTVWLATQESLDREVALKVLSSKLAADDAFVRRFQDEARAAAALGHPNVVTVYDVGESSGLHYLAMEFMPGGSLEDHLSAVGNLPWEEVATILRDAAAGLEYAEGRGIVHRDIKPANLMRGEGGTIRIADLGLATSVEEAVELGAAEGGKRRIQGTPHFIAPELVRGTPPGPRTDLYALGVTAFQLLSGHTPFEGKSSNDILKSALHDQPANLTQLAPNAPQSLVQLIERLIARDPAERPGSAATVKLEAMDLLGGVGSVPQAVVRPKSGAPKGLLLGGAALLIASIGAWSILGGGDPDDSGDGIDATADAGMQSAGSDPGPSAQAGGDGESVGAGETGQVPELMPSAFDGGESSGQAGPVGDEAEQRFEEKAELEYLRLGQLLLSPEERIVRLRALAETFQGSDTAAQALAEADGLQTALNTTIKAEREESEARTAALDALRAAAALEEANRRPGDALRALFAVEGQEEWAADEPYQTARAALLTEILELGAERAEILTARAQDKLGEGRFEDAREDYVALLALVDVPKDMVLRQRGVDALERMRALAGQARVKLSNMEQIAADFAVEIVRADQRAMVAGFGGQSGLERDLTELDLATAIERLRQLKQTLRTPEAEASLVPLLDGLEQAGKTRTALQQAWAAGQWRRKTVLAPTGDGMGTEAKNAIGIGSGGVQIEGGQTISWSALMRHPKALSNLFQARLERNWSADEQLGAATLVRIASVLAAVEGASEMFDGTNDERLTDREAEEIVSGFEYAAEWLDGLTGAGRQSAEQSLEAERSAAEILAKALLAVSDKRPAEASTLLERLLDESSSTLLVRLMSDDSDWRTEPGESAGESSAEQQEREAPDRDENEDDDSGDGQD